jgi:hypothetical protein
VNYQQSNTLPQAARDILVAASRVDSKVPFGFVSLPRAVAVDHAIRKVKQRFPKFFNLKGR